ncbi:unknown [Parabacteroides sp. CAG:409]|jgi:flagellar basal body-associated protein FliL|nr:unknown [Parabacteroides sp. CAG:409]
MLTIMSCITLLIIAITGVLYFNYQDKKEEKNKQSK